MVMSACTVFIYKWILCKYKACYPYLEYCNSAMFQYRYEMLSKKILVTWSNLKNKRRKCKTHDGSQVDWISIFIKKIISLNKSFILFVMITDLPLCVDQMCIWVPNLRQCHPARPQVKRCPCSAARRPYNRSRSRRLKPPRPHRDPPEKSVMLCWNGLL